ncbi:hypothetical protein D3C77_762170 [compost metagenome]
MQALVVDEVVLVQVAPGDHVVVVHQHPVEGAGGDLQLGLAVGFEQPGDQRIDRRGFQAEDVFRAGTVGVRAVEVAP